MSKPSGEAQRACTGRDQQDGHMNKSTTEHPPSAWSREARRAATMLLGTAILSAIIGYTAGALRNRPSAGQPPAEFVKTQSFSVTDNAKGVLDAECRHFLLDWGRRYFAVAKGPDARPDDVPVNEMIAELKTVAGQFQGTEQERMLRRHLLVALFHSGRHADWLEVYLQGLYERPNEALVSEWAHRAMEIGHALRRQQEVIDGLRHWLAIPWDLDGKSEVAGLLAVPAPGSPPETRASQAKAAEDDHS
jgi:hypothetical protein